VGRSTVWILVRSEGSSGGPKSESRAILSPSMPRSPDPTSALIVRQAQHPSRLLSTFLRHLSILSSRP
jgi:hypothetical protein